MTTLLQHHREKLLAWITERESVLDQPRVSKLGVANNSNDNAADQFKRLPDNEKTTLVAWMINVFQPAAKVCRQHTSYGLKHYFEHSPLGFYVTNGEFKGAMLIAGFEPWNADEMNWRYHITATSVERVRQVSTNQWN